MSRAVSDKTNHTTAKGHSNHNCAGGILEILTQQGSIPLQVTENDIIKLLLTLQTILAVLHLYWQWIPSKQTAGSGLCPQSKTITSEWITEKCPSRQEEPRLRTKNDTANKSEQPLPLSSLLSSCSIAICQNPSVSHTPASYGGTNRKTYLHTVSYLNNLFNGSRQSEH